jgi:two-component system sensor histidine kinase CreC
MDYSEKRDVHRTLRGKYGARSSRTDEQNPLSSVLHVGALVGPPQNPFGVLTVYKPQADVLPIVDARRRAIYWGTGLVGSGILLLVAAVFIWQYLPVGRLTEYAREIESGKRPPLPKLGAGKEVNTLARALESMREALEGRRYAERYVQTLTHEMKSPLAAIRGAAELLGEDMPPADRHRFLENIRAESGRAERLLNALGLATRVAELGGGPYRPDELLAHMAHDKKARNGQLRLCNIAKPIFEIFKITKLDKLFQTLGTEEQAVKSLA